MNSISLSAPPTSQIQPAPSTVAGFDNASATAEGWGVFAFGVREDGTLHIEIQRIDVPSQAEPPFTTDDQAWHHVVRHARQGSALHRHALALTDPIERMSIESTCGSWPGS